MSITLLLQMMTTVVYYIIESLITEHCLAPTLISVTIIIIQRTFLATVLESLTIYGLFNTVERNLVDPILWTLHADHTVLPPVTLFSTSSWVSHILPLTHNCMHCTACMYDIMQSCLRARNHVKLFFVN